MKLLLHNLLSSKYLKGVKTGFPLILRVTKTEKLDLEAQEDERKLFIQQIIPKLDYNAFKNAVSVVDPKQNDLPEVLPQDWKTDSSFLDKVYDWLVGVEIVEGELECPETHRIFPINEGIPNMLVRAEEVEGESAGGSTS